MGIEDIVEGVFAGILRRTTADVERLACRLNDGQSRQFGSGQVDRGLARALS